MKKMIVYALSGLIMMSCSSCQKVEERISMSVDVWDGKSFFSNIENNKKFGREFLIISQNAWSCQRTVRFDNWALIKTYHTGLKNFPERMLYDYEKDFHMINNIAEEKPEIVNYGLKLLEIWYKEMLEKEPKNEDPMKIVLKEGGPFHTRGMLDNYLKRLQKSGRQDMIKTIQNRKESYNI